MTDPVTRMYFDYYRTPCGFHPRSPNSNGAWAATAPMSFMNLPLLTYIAEIHLGRLQRHEKISDLPKKLSTRGAPEGVEPAAGDIAYYAPWGNLAIFYKDFEYSRGLVKLGAIESSARAFERPGSLRVTIEPVEE